MKSATTMTVIAISAIMLLAHTMPAASTEFTDGNATGFWDDPLNWSAGIPGAADTVTIGAGKAAVVRDAQAAGTVSAWGDAASKVTIAAGGDLTVNTSAFIAGELILEAGGNLDSVSTRVGYGSPGFLTQTGGTANYLGPISVGHGGVAAAGSKYTMTGGTLTYTASFLFVGYGSTGIFDQQGGTVTAPDKTLDLGAVQSATPGDGTYVISGGDLDVNFIKVDDYQRGDGNLGQFTVIGTGPVIMASSNVFIGSGGTVEFVLEADGVAKIYVGGKLWLDRDAEGNGKLVVDASAYDASNGLTVELIDYTVGLGGDWSSVTVIPPACYAGAVDNGDNGGFIKDGVVTLNLTPVVPCAAGCSCAAVEAETINQLCAAAEPAASLQSLEQDISEAYQAAIALLGCAPDQSCLDLIISHLGL